MPDQIKLYHPYAHGVYVHLDTTEDVAGWEKQGWSETPPTAPNTTAPPHTLTLMERVARLEQGGTGTPLPGALAPVAPEQVAAIDTRLKAVEAAQTNPTPAPATTTALADLDKRLKAVEAQPATSAGAAGSTVRVTQNANGTGTLTID